MKLKKLDVVRTKTGVLAIVEAVAKDGTVSLVWPPYTRHKAESYKSEDLEYVASAWDCADAYLHARRVGPGMHY